VQFVVEPSFCQLETSPSLLPGIIIIDAHSCGMRRLSHSELLLFRDGHTAFGEPSTSSGTTQVRCCLGAMTSHY